jgi:hypothetical protein
MYVFGPVSILVGNQAAIQSSEKPTTKPSHYILYHLHRLIKQVKAKHDLKTDNITVRWIPGHKDVEGNEKADEEARKVALSHMNNSSPQCLPRFIKSDPLSNSVSALKHAYKERSKHC